MNHIKQQFLTIVFIFACLLGCNSKTEIQTNILPQSTDKEYETATVTTGTQTFTALVASTPALRRVGLMNRAHLDSNKGMLFILDKPSIQSFWMKNTLIPLDIIWISEDFRVVDIQQASPCSHSPCTRYAPKTTAKYVLEVNQGSFTGRVGSLVIIDF